VLFFGAARGWSPGCRRHRKRRGSPQGLDGPGRPALCFWYRPSRVVFRHDTYHAGELPAGAGGRLALRRISLGVPDSTPSLPFTVPGGALSGLHGSWTCLAPTWSFTQRG
jgi:hypothetical protein